MLKGSLIIGQSGGPSSVINASAYGVIRTALDADCITKVYGAYHGIKGVLDDQLLCMDEEDRAELDRLPYTPSSALGSCRYKIADPDVDVYKRQPHPLPYWKTQRLAKIRQPVLCSQRSSSAASSSVSAAKAAR